MKPKILHLSADDSGGAGSAAYSLFAKLRSEGYESRLITLTKKKEDKDVLELNNFIKFKRKIRRFLFKKRFETIEKYEMKGVDEKPTFIKSKEIINTINFKPNVIFVYWISTFLNAKNIFELSEFYNAPVIICPTDMAPFTGGCHFLMGCEEYKNSCNDCPGVKLLEHKEEINKILSFKKHFYSKTKMAVVVSTSNLKKQVESSELFKSTPNYLIRYHIEDLSYKPGSKKELRKKYGISNDSIVFLVAASFIKNERKGFDYLMKSVLNLNKLLISKPINKNFIFIVLGNGSDEFCKEFPFETLSLGFVKNKNILNEIYTISDVFLNSSIDDAGPLMLIEAMIYENAIISYDIGIAPDLIKNDKTGYISENLDFVQYSKYMYEILKMSSENLKKIQTMSRFEALENHNWNDKANKYEEVFKEIGIIN